MIATRHRFMAGGLRESARDCISMYRAMCFLGLLLLGSASVTFGQQERPAAPQSPEDAFTARELIAWTSLQKPQPAPQPLPKEDAVPQPGQTPDQQAKPPADANSQQTPARLFSGTIVKSGDGYVLRTDCAIYQLQKKSGIEQYEDRKVKVIGTLDQATAWIQVVEIELYS